MSWIKDGKKFVNPLKLNGMVIWNPREAQLREAGYHWVIDPIPEPQPLTICTRYQLVRCLEAYHADMLTQLRAAYEANADLRFYWNTVNELDRTNADFKAAQAALGVTDEQVDVIFEEIRLHGGEWSTI